MASNSETGHVVNIANFKLLIDKCVAFTTNYKPSNTDLTVANMTLLWKAGDDSHKALTTVMQLAKNPINAREILFAPLDKLVTKTLNILKSTKASKQLKADAKTLADRIRGFGVKTKKMPDGTENPNSVSTSHQSFVQRQDTFKQLIDLYKNEPLYAPAEVELKTVTLDVLNASMKTANDGIGLIITPVDTARVARDKSLYAESTGMVDLALQCKDYVKGAFGSKAPEAKLVTGIKFTRPKKK